MSDVIELIDPWHEPGYRINVETLPTVITTIAVGDVTETPDPVTKLRPSDTVTGEYRYVGRTTDGTPTYEWRPRVEDHGSTRAT